MACLEAFRLSKKSWSVLSEWMLWSDDVVIGLIQRGYDKFKKRGVFLKEKSLQ